MKLELIITDPDKYQFREQAFSEQTVEGIVHEGIDVAKFDPIPVVKRGDRFVVAGDGHSRFEACRRLADERRLPRAWRVDGSWDIPHRIVSTRAAMRLAYEANMSRDQFTPLEEARIFQARVDEGESIADIAESSHKTTTHVTRTLALLDLCRDIQDAIDAPEGGINLLTAQRLSSGFKQYGITKDQQRDLWHSALKQANLNAGLATRVVNAIGKRLQGVQQEQGMLLALPPNMGAIIGQAKAQFVALRAAKQGLGRMLDNKDALACVPELHAWLVDRGDAVHTALQAELDDEANLLAGDFGRKAVRV